MSNQQKVSRSVTVVKPEDVQRDENGRLQLDPLHFNRRMRRGFTRATQTTPLFHLITNYLALDIEFQLVFCKKTGKHIQRVGRLSICNYFGVIIYDVFAFYPHMEGYIKKLPPARLKLGVYWNDIKPSFGARPIAEVEEAVRQIIQDRVVVGHAIHNDIKVLSPWVFEGIETRDTQLHACYRPYALRPGGPPGLKTLAPAILGYSIQGEEHSSGEDAQATMGLFHNCEPCIEREQGKGIFDTGYGEEEFEYDEDDLVEEDYSQIDEYFAPPEIEPKEWIRPPLTASGNFWKAGQAMLTGKSATSEITESLEMSKSKSATSLSSLASQSTTSTISSTNTTESSLSSSPSTESTFTTAQKTAETKTASNTMPAGAFWAEFRKRN